MGVYTNLISLISNFPECYQATTNQKKVADTLSTEIKKTKECYPYFELETEQDAFRKLLLTKQETK